MGGDWAVVGAWQATGATPSDEGAAYVFLRQGSDWIQVAKLTDTTPPVPAADQFGRAVSTDGAHVFTGAPSDSFGGLFRGSVSVHGLGSVCDPTLFRRGDADGDEITNGLVDGLFVLTYQFVPGTSDPPCLDAADADDSGDLNGILDGLRLLNFQFLGGTPPPPPGLSCGVDPTDDNFDCSMGCP